MSPFNIRFVVQINFLSNLFYFEIPNAPEYSKPIIYANCQSAYLFFPVNFMGFIPCYIFILCKTRVWNTSKINFKSEERLTFWISQLFYLCHMIKWIHSLIPNAFP